MKNPTVSLGDIQDLLPGFSKKRWVKIIIIVRVGSLAITVALLHFFISPVLL